MNGLTTEFFDAIPKDRDGNKRYRHWLIERCRRDPKAAAEVVEMCRRDLLFYIASMGWIQEPRKKTIYPFLTFPFQNVELTAIVSRIFGDGSEEYVAGDIPVFKSREMGFTWMALYVCDWLHRFYDHVHIGLVSKDLEAVDSHGAGSLMSKLDFIADRLPPFMPGTGKGRERLRATHTIRNLDRNSSIVGFAATDDVATGDRFFLMFMDEFHKFNVNDDYYAMSSTQFVTDCRIVGSTVDPKKGANGAFYDLVCRAKEDGTLIEMHWSKDPRKSPGLYTSDADGNVTVLDEGYEFPEGYRFVADGKIRSPYYDREEARALDRNDFACELDMTFSAGASNLFDPSMLERLIYGENRTVRPHRYEGFVQFDPATMRGTFVERKDGPWKVWCPLDVNGEPPRLTQYTLGQDVASGTGGEYSSYSSIVVFDKRTGEQVAKYSSNTIKPVDFAHLMAAASYWFRDSSGTWGMLNPEVNGTGGQTVFLELERLIGDGFPLQAHRERRGVGSKRDLKLGTHVDDKKKAAILAKFDEGLRTGKVVVRDEVILKECGEYVFENGVPVHRKSKNTKDEAAKGAAHGDSAVAASMAWWCVVDVKIDTTERAFERKATSPMQFAYRTQMHLEEAEGQESETVFG